MPLYPLIAFRKAEATCKSLEETAKDTPAFFEALQKKEAARKALFEADEQREAAIKTLNKAKKDSKELAIAANKAQGVLQKARKAEQVASTTATGAKATQAADKGKGVVQTKQVANEARSGVEATQATTQQAGAIKGANQPLKPLTHVSESQAEEVAKAVGGRVKGPAQNKNGYVIDLGSLERPTKIRLMNTGSGQREQAYFRITKHGKGALTREGVWSSDPAITHFDLHSGDIADQVREILDKAVSKGIIQ